MLKRMSLRRITGLALASLLTALMVAGCGGEDDPISFGTTLRATMDQSSVVLSPDNNPPTPGPSTGTATFLVSPDRSSIDVNVSGNILQPPTQGQDYVQFIALYLGQPGSRGRLAMILPESRREGENQRVIYDLPYARTLTAADFTPMPESGLTSFQDLVEMILAGRTFMQISTSHSTPHPHIRGQILPVQP